MPDGPSLLTRIVASIRALLPSDWFGRAGQRFRDATQAVSDFAEEHHLRPKDIAEEGIELGRRKLEGLANQEYATALKDFADAEQKTIETEFQRRSLESKVRREEAQAQKEEVEVRLAELKVIEAEVQLRQKLTEAGVILYRDSAGNLTALSLPPSCDLVRPAERRLIEARQDAGALDDPHQPSSSAED
ncbi:MAG: hypothetical protein ABSE56_03935 [Bryobacteraceae bacterium]|jgi:hypothetical protein